MVGPADGDDLDRDLTSMIARERAGESARSRSKERHLRASAVTEATLAGILLDVAECRDEVRVSTVFGRTLTGLVALVAKDAIVLDSAVMGRSYIPFAGIATFRRLVARPIAGPSGDRGPPRAATFAALVGDLAPEHPQVALAVTGERALLTGELRAVGADVITIALTGDGVAHVAIAQVSELTVLASG